MDQKPPAVMTTAPAPTAQSPNPCNPGEAWTCTVQCDPGTRAPAERLFGTPGVEACVAVRCQCEQQIVPRGADISDPTLPVVFVIFGVGNLLRR